MITTGSASSSTGLAGRIRSAIDTFFSTYVRDYTPGSVGQKGLDAFAQGIVDSFNNDRAGLAQFDAFPSAFVQAQIGAFSYGTGGSFTDVPGSSVSLATSGVRKIRVDVSISMFMTTIADQFFIRLLMDGTEVSRFTGFYNTLSQHQGWSFSWLIAAPAAATHTFKVQLTSGGTGVLQTASADYIGIIVAEI